MVKTMSVWLSYVLAALVAASSAAGVLSGRVYAFEKPTWAAQGVGQDIVNIVVAVPVLLVSAYLAQKGRRKATLVWIGALMYSVYSSFYLLMAAVLGADADAIARASSERTPIRLTGNLLIGLSVVFYLMWGSDVIGSLLSGTAPHSAIDVGFPVNPIHVMDMALFLPGMIVTGLLLHRRRPLGYFMTAPFLVCSIIIGVAVMGMVVVMTLRGFSPAYPAIAAIGTSTILSSAALVLYLRSLNTP